MPRFPLPSGATAGFLTTLQPHPHPHPSADPQAAAASAATESAALASLAALSASRSSLVSADELAFIHALAQSRPAAVPAAWQGAPVPAAMVATARTRVLSLSEAARAAVAATATQPALAA